MKQFKVGSPHWRSNSQRGLRKSDRQIGRKPVEWGMLEAQWLGAQRGGDVMDLAMSDAADGPRTPRNEQ